jgi:hypothetical protein
VAPLLLLAIGGRRLPTIALAARGLALFTGHCDDGLCFFNNIAVPCGGLWSAVVDG